MRIDKGVKEPAFHRPHAAGAWLLPPTIASVTRTTATWSAAAQPITIAN